MGLFGPTGRDVLAVLESYNREIEDLINEWGEERLIDRIELLRAKRAQDRMLTHLQRLGVEVNVGD